MEVWQAAVAKACVAGVHVVIGSHGGHAVVLGQWGGRPGHQRTAVPAGPVYRQISGRAWLWEKRTRHTTHELCKSDV